MGYILLFITASGWGMLSAIVIKNEIASLAVALFGGFFIGILFAHFGLLF